MPEYEQNAAEVIFPDGTYEFQCVDACEKESDKTHNTMIELQLDCSNADLTEKVRVVDRLVFTPNSYWKIDSFRKATGEKISAGGKVSFEAEDCIDRQGRCQLKTTSYNGRSRNEVDYYLEPDEGGQQASTGSAPPSTGSAPPSPQPQPAPKGTVPKSGQPF
jgi:hypothetical protein